MVSLRVNKIDSVSPLRTGLALSPRKKPLRSKSTGSLGSHASGWDAKGKQSWIHDNFFQRNCFKFVANPKKTSGDICCCGRSLSNHDDPITNHNTVSWTPDSCTKKIPTKAFGEIQFVGSANQSARAPYVRLAEDTNVQLVMKLIKKVWKLEVPNLVISVTGGAKSFHLKPRLKEVFQRGLIKAAKSTGAWIITGGTNTGVMKHVGEAVRHMKVVGGASSDINVIGVATWGIVDRSADLTSESGLGYHPARYHTTPEEASKAPLDSSHTHFILVDNGTVRQYGVEIDLRSKIEEAISKEHTESRSSTGSIEVPVVMLVLEGGPGTVKTMTEAIKKKIPAVVIDGSGRAADVVAFAYKHTIPNTKNGKTVHVIDPAYKESVEAKVVEVFGERSLKNVYSMIEDVLEDEKMVTIYRLDEGGNTSRDIDLAILKALLKASRSSPLAQLNLALAWNRVDVAESDIFTENTRFKSDDLHNPMLTALLDDKADFVRLFLENGLSMREFLTVERLCVLYRSVSNSGILGSLIRHQMKKRGTKYITPQLIGYAIEELMGDSYHSYYLNNVRYFSEPQRNSSQFLRIRLSSPGTFVDATDNAEGNHTLPFSFLDVFTWAILSGKKELAKVLWEKGTYAIATALFATKLLKEMVEHSQDDHQVIDSSEELIGLANEYESLAVGMLDTCYMSDEDIAQSLIVRPLKPFGWLTCMDIAWLAKDQDFIAHSSCQILFNRLWMGGILMDTPWWKVLLCVLFPFLIYPMIYFVVDEYEDTKENFQNQEDLNMNTDEQKDALEAADNNAVITNYRQFNNSMEMSELKDGNTKEQQVPKVIQQPRLNLLSEGEDDAVDNILRVSEVNCFQRVLRFYEAPFTKFVTNVCSYVAFLLMFCIVMLMNFEKYNVSVMEYILMGWVGVLMLEEIRQMLSQHPKHMYEKINLYLADAWNFVDILSLLAFAVASVLRFFPDDFDGDLFEAARIIYILDIILFIVRSLQMFAVSRQLGPKLVMIKTMLEDLKQFIIILAVFIVSYGVALQATLYPNTTNFWEVLKGIIQKPYFQMYGELFYEDFTEDPNIHDDGRWLGPALLGVYMLLTNVLLLNLLIAIFNYTFEKIQEGSDRVWKFQRYDLIREYHDRPTLAPPMMIISHVFVFIKWIVQMCGCGPKAARGSALKLNLDERENDQLSSWENHSRDMGLLKRKADEEEQMEQKVKNIDSKIDELSNQVERMMELSCDPSSIADSGNKNDKSRVRGLRSAHHSRNFEASISARVDSLEDRLIETSHTLEKILEIVSSSAFGKSDGRTEFSAGRKSVHIKARKSPYPLSTIMRISFPDTLVPWETPFPTYNPPTYTSPSVAKNPPWADVDVISLHSRPVLKFNEFDNECNVNRRSYSGPYKVVDGLPFNPMGRTGMTGRGLLGRFGPNHAADPIVTRWKMTSSGALIENGKKVLEFVAIQRKDNQEWAIPGGMVEPGQQISKTLKKEFMEEALAGLDLEDEEREELKVQVDGLFQKGIEVFKGYVDDPRNTDVAWVETLAMNYHDDSGEIFNKIKLQAGDDAAAVRWQRVSGNIPLYANHVAMLENVANLHNANF